MLSVSKIFVETNRRVEHPSLYSHGVEACRLLITKSETEKSTKELDMEFVGDLIVSGPGV